MRMLDERLLLHDQITSDLTTLENPHLAAPKYCFETSQLMCFAKHICLTRRLREVARRELLPTKSETLSFE